jgi:hypothetical protein
MRASSLLALGIPVSLAACTPQPLTSIQARYTSDGPSFRLHHDDVRFEDTARCEGGLWTVTAGPQGSRTVVMSAGPKGAGSATVRVQPEDAPHAVDVQFNWSHVTRERSECERFVVTEEPASPTTVRGAVHITCKSVHSTRSRGEASRGGLVGGRG